MGDICLVTGGAGFIGSHLVEELTVRGKTVRVLDNLDTGQRANLTPLRPAPELVEGDVGNLADVERAMIGVGVVFHLAALASVQRSVDDPLGSQRINATGTLHVLDAARRAGVRRVVFSASSSAYGGAASEIQRETDPVRPLSPYAAAKLSGELYAAAFATTYGLETVCLRFFNIFGPRQRDDSPYSGVIALFLSIMSAGKAPRIDGDGEQSRDFTYVGNAVDALIRAAEASGASGKVYNVGTGRRVSLLELVATLNRLLGTNLTPRHGPSRAGDVRHSCADIAAARRDLGYEPTVAFEEGLARTLRWYQERKG